MSANKKCLLIVGGSGGLGSALAEEFTDKYEVIATSSKTLDVLNRHALESFFAEVEPDIVLNMSGYNYDCMLHRYSEDNYSEIEKQIDIVAKGNVYLLNACLPGMRSRGFGRIVLASSILVSKPVLGTSVYTASKSFVEGLVKACSIENYAKGITANALQIGYFDAGLTHRIPAELSKKIESNLPAKRWGKIDELASIVEMLINNAYISGTTVKVNGGAEF